MKIVMIASEANPLVKSGGLADVVFSLSDEINKNEENEAIIILPFYKSLKFRPGIEHIKYFYIAMSWRNQYVGLFRLKEGNITYYLIDNEYYFDRDALYGYDDDGERFAYFALAATEALKVLDYKPDIIHCHDWQSAMIPCIVKEKYKGDPFFKNTKFCLTIHNPAFKGFLDKYFLANFFGLSDELYFAGKVRLDNQVSTLKTGIVYSDVVTTVSKQHRLELLNKDTSFGLSDDLKLREYDFYGIVNGVDNNEFNPSKDKLIKKKYSKTSFLEGKKENKVALLERFNLPVDDSPVFSIVSRLTWQKGIDLVLQSAYHIIANGGKIIVLGSGESHLEQGFRDLQNKFPNNVATFIGYSNNLAHTVYAGSDFFLMPSLFEPCGIGQIIAQRYGTLPIVRETGGLVDTVKHLHDGFSFHDYTSYALNLNIDMALEAYKNKTELNKLIKNAMTLDHSWKVSAEEYLEVYRKALKK